MFNLHTEINPFAAMATIGAFIFTIGLLLHFSSELPQFLMSLGGGTLAVAAILGLTD